MANTSTFLFNCSNDTNQALVVEANDSVTADIPVPDVMRSPTEIAVVIVILSIIILISLIGNASVIAVVFMYEELREQVSNIFIVSLAVIDFLTSIVVMMPTASAIIADKWILGKIGCDLHCNLNYGLLMNSYMTLMVISMDRTEAVVHSLHYASRVTKTRALIVVGVLWVFCTSWCSTPAVNNWVKYDYWEANCGIDWELSSPMLWVFGTVGCFYCPSFSVIIISSIIIIRSAEKSNKNLQIPSKNTTSGVQTVGHQNIAPQENDSTTSNKKLVKSLIVLILTFNACVSPFVIIRTVKLGIGLGSDVGKNVFLKWLSTCSSFCMYISSATNPFIYAIFRKDFRNAFRKLFRSISRKISPY